MSGLPGYVSKYFWGDNLDLLSWEQNAKYITETILNRGNTEAVNWLLNKVERPKLVDNIDKFKLNPKSANFWRIYLS